MTAPSSDSSVLIDSILRRDEPFSINELLALFHHSFQESAEAVQGHLISLEKLSANREELAGRIAAACIELGGKNPYSSEKSAVVSKYPEAFEPSHLSKQVQILQHLFPGLGYFNSFGEHAKDGKTTISNGAEAYYAFPHWSKIAPTYVEAVKEIHRLLYLLHRTKFENFAKDSMTSDTLRESQKKVRKIAQIRASQQSDICVVPAQFGVKYAGWSPRNALADLDDNAFALGAFETGILLLTHPERINSYTDLWIDCPGDEMRMAVHETFFGVPTYHHGNDFLRFKVSLLSEHRGSAGSITAYIQK